MKKGAKKAAEAQATIDAAAAAEKDESKKGEFERVHLSIAMPDSLVDEARLIKALLSARAAVVSLQEAIMLQRIRGQAKTSREARVQADVQLGDAQDYLRGKNDDALRKAARKQRADELTREALALGLTESEYSVAT